MFEIINNTKKDIKEITNLNNYINFLTKELNIENAIFNIIFVTNDEIHRLNKEYRNIDRVTDVISFALEDNKKIDLESIRVLGDIYIAIDVAYNQAREYNHSKEREVSFLATHGVLHLLGYDHMNPKDEKIMFDLQEELLSKYNITRK